MFAPPSACAPVAEASSSSLERGDGLADKYSHMASDSAQGPKAREAAMLFSAAELSLNSEDGATALAKAKEALALFRELGESTGVSDTLRLIVNAHLEKEEAEEALELATQELRAFEKVSDKRGQAAMLLSTAEITYNGFGSKQREEAIEAATRARAIYAELQDSKMEGMALLAVLHARITRGTKHDSREQLETALATAEQARSAFRNAKDQSGEAKVLHAMATIHAYLDSCEDCLKFAKQALALWRELGIKKLEGMELRCLAEWQLAEDKAEEALKSAEMAKQIFEDMGKNKGWEVAALSTLVRAHLKLLKFSEAQQLIKEAVRRFESLGDEAAIVTATGLEVELELARDDRSRALQAAEKCLDAVRALSKRTPLDRKFEAYMLHTSAQIQAAEGDQTEAKACCQSAIAIFKSLGEKHQVALVLHTLSSAYVGLKEFREAVKAAAESRDIFRKRAHKRGHAYSCLACCHAYCARGEHNRAISMSKEALKIFVDERQRKGEAEALSMLAEVYLMRGTPQKCIIHARECRELFRELGDTGRELEEIFVIAKGLFWAAHEESKGEPLQGEKAWERALQGAQEALTASRAMGLDRSVVAALFGLGQIYVVRRRLDEASKLIEEAMPLARQHEDAVAEANLDLLQAQVHIAAGRNVKAMDPARKAIEIFSDQLKDSEGVDVARELIRFAERGGLAASEEKDVLADSGADVGEAAITHYQGPSQEELKAVIADVALSLIGVDELEHDTPLMDAGLDSLASVEFQNNLQKEFAGAQMPSTLVFDYPSVNTMVEFINGVLREAAGFQAVEN